MEREDFIKVNDERYLKFVDKIIENNGKCNFEEDCLNCPFDRSNNPKGIHCAQSGLTYEYIDDDEEDPIMLKSAIKFKELYSSGV